MLSSSGFVQSSSLPSEKSMRKTTTPATTATTPQQAQQRKMGCRYQGLRCAAAPTLADTAAATPSPGGMSGVDASAPKIKLTGVAIGNGLTDPEIQYEYYKDMIVSTNDHEAAVGKVVHAAMVAATPPCVAAIKQCNKNHTYGACLPALEGCEIALEIPYTATGMNPYDMREKCKVPPLCYDFSNVATYLKRDDVRAALNVPKAAKWSDCNRAVTMGFELAGDYMKEYQQLIPDLIEDGIRYLIYAGDQDYICNWLGNQAWTLALPWSGKDAFNAAPVADWDVAGKKAGELRKTDMFSFLRVIDAGHMVPMDLSLIHI